MTPARPLLRYHGGKWRLEPWIIAHMPKHKVYVEPFCGAASVLLLKPRVNAEVINDLEGRVVNVFRVLQDPVTADLLRQRLALTPYSRAEFDRCYQEPALDAVDGAAKTIMLSQMGHGTDTLGRTCRTGFRSKLSGSGLTPAMSWATWPDQIPAFVERLRGVVIESRDACEVMSRLDSTHTLHYVDPPYIASTRSSLSDGKATTHGYRHELTDDQHVELSKHLKSLRGMVLLSGYSSMLYDHLYRKWERVECQALADRASIRTECLWLNPAAAKRYSRQGTLQIESAA